MNKLFDVIVIGGGVVGMSAALAMQQRGYRVALLDAGIINATIKGLDPRVYAINHASQQLFKRLDVWQCMDQSRLSPYRHMHVWDAANSAKIDFDAREIATDRLGTIIEESVIKQALIKKLTEQAVTFCSECRVIDIKSTPESIVIHDEHNNTWQSDLMMVADGANSSMRTLLGISMTSWPYHQQAIVATVATEKPHQLTAYQVFNSDGPLAFLPLVDEQHCSIVWSTSVSHASTLMQKTDEDFSKALAKAFAYRLGDCQVIGKRYQFPLVMRHIKQYTGPRWIMMGDAAHTFHPLAGLGLNVGLQDVATWLEALDNNKNNMPLEKILSMYQRQRKHQVWQVIALMESLKMMFANPLPPFTSIRGLGLQWCDRFSPIKRWLIQQATSV